MSVPAERPAALTCLPVEDVGEVRPGDDLVALLAAATSATDGPGGLVDGDVLVVTSKVLSKAEGRIADGTREDLLDAETDRLVARRGRTSIVRTHHGLVMAAAGIDASNTGAGAGSVLLLPRDPDASARALREGLRAVTGANVAVLVTDTAGRAWRTGQTDIAIGVAGLDPLHDHAGRTDPDGHLLAVTAPAVADELAGAADLVKRKLDRRPAAVVRGLAPLVLEPGRHGPGAAALVRSEQEDLFGLGARQAVLEALRAGDGRGFGAPCPADELVGVLASVGGRHADVRLVGVDGVVGEEAGEAVRAELSGGEREQGATEARLRAAAFALGWATRTGSAPSLLGFLRNLP